MGTTPHAEVEAFLDRYGEALAGGDLAGIAACYTLPALVAGDGAAIPIAEPGQVEAAFAGAADADRAQGLVGIRAELRGVDRLTPNLLLADVRWAYLDQGGEARRHSSYRYLLRRSAADGRLRIQVVVDTTPPGWSQAAVSGTGWGTGRRGPNRRPWTRATPRTTTRPPTTRRIENGSPRTRMPAATATRGTR